MADNIISNKLRRELQGSVLKVIDAKTIKIRVERKYAHKKYSKIIKKHKSYLAHTEDSSNVTVGDLVTIQETKPISKRKAWILITK